jgi:Cof subfamily protein (haloacid dehalogenase superfamily)
MTEQTKVSQTTTKPPKRDIRVIALDIDGTLLDSKHALTPRVEQAIKAATAKGIKVVLATGKTRHSTVKLVEQLGIRAPAIYLQGLAIYDENSAITHQWKLDLAVARQVITFAEDRGFMVVGFSEDRILARVDDAKLREGFSNYHEITPEVVGPLQNILREIPVNKLIVMGDPKAIKALRWQLDLQLGGKARTMQAGVPWMVEILPPGTSKGIALKQLLKDMKVNPENVLAVGDAENDMEMIQLAGVGVAMGQAAQNVKDIADWVTKTCDEDGVAEAIERYVLTEPEAAKVESVPAAAPAVVIEPTPAVTPAQDTEENVEPKS